MKRMNEVFELPVVSGERGYEADDIFQAGGNGVWCATFCSDEQAKSACSAINHIDALADALEGLLNRLHYEGCDFADMAVAATALSAYRGGI